MEQSARTALEHAFPMIRDLCEHHRGDGSALIVVLQKIQDAYGYIPKESLPYIAQSLMVSSSHLYGTMTFYDRFRLTPRRKYTIKVCRGTACELNGAPPLIAKLGEIFTVAKDGTVDHPLFSLEHSACLGECQKSPVVSVGDEAYLQVTPEKLEAVIQEMLEKESGTEAKESTVA